MDIMSILHLIIGFVSLGFGLYIKQHPKTKYVNNKNDPNNIVLWGKKKGIKKLNPFVSILSYELFPIFLFGGICLIVFSIFETFYEIPKKNDAIKAIYMIFYFFWMFITFWPLRIYKKSEKKFNEILDLEAYYSYYNNPTHLNSQISIKKEWNVDIRILALFLIFGLVLIAFNKPFTSYKSLLSLIYLIAAFINIKYLENIPINYIFILDKNLWTKYIKQTRLACTITIMISTYLLLVLSIFFK